MFILKVSPCSIDRSILGDLKVVWIKVITFIDLWRPYVLGQGCQTAERSEQDLQRLQTGPLDGFTKL